MTFTFRSMQLGVAVMAAASMMFGGGGYWLEFANPSASTDPAAKDALVVVRAVGCGEPDKSVMTGVAEGKAGGEHRKIQLQVAPLKTPGLYAVKGDLPKDGKWVLVLTGNYKGATVGALLPVHDDKVDRKLAKVTRIPPTASDISAALGE